MEEIVIPATAHSPALHIHVNLPHNLYHYLASEAQRIYDHPNPVTREAAMLLAQARFPLGNQGIWSVFERPLAAGSTVEEAVDGLAQAVANTAHQLGEVLRQGEAFFREVIWPQRLPLVEAALATLRNHLVPHFPAMARRQAALLDLTWPPYIDAYLVTDCHDQRGGYSHPVTVDIAEDTGVVLCETILHEATHVADTHTLTLGIPYLWPRLRAHFAAHGLGRQAWDVWHGVIFAASADQVKTFIDPGYRDYAHTHNSPTNNLYSWLKVPQLPLLWAEYAAGALDETAFIEALMRERTGAGAPT